MDSKPLTAGEIEELRELEARATGGEWRVGEPDANGQPTVSDKYIELLSCWHHSVGSIEKEAHANAALIAAMRNALPRLISLLTPPPDAAVREAVDVLSAAVSEDDDASNYLDNIHTPEVRTLLRAVQATRLTGEQREFLMHIEDCLATTNAMWPKEKKSLWYCLRAAFPELFAGEE